MTYADIALKARTSAGWSVALLGFAIPVSTAFDSVLVAATLFACLVAMPAYLTEWRVSRCYDKPVLIALALFCTLVLACLWSPVPWRTAWSSLSNYLDLLLIPMFAWIASSPDVRKRAFAAFAIAIGLNLAVSYGSALGLWQTLPGLRTYPEYPIGFRLSITHNILMSVAAFLFLLAARELRLTRRRAALACLGFALLCIFNVLFVVIGRTGYVVLAALLVYLAASARSDRRRALLGVLLIVALFASAYSGSQFFSSRVQDIASDLKQWQPGANDTTSVGLRIGYYRTSWEIVREQPLTGVGTGGFAQAYADRVRGTAAPETQNPHNDYLMIAVQAGLPAMAMLIALYVFLWRDAPRLGSPLERDLLRGLVLTMAIGGLFNSLLMDHVEGLLFAWMTGLLYAGCRENIASHAKRIGSGRSVLPRHT